MFLPSASKPWCWSGSLKEHRGTQQRKERAGAIERVALKYMHHSIGSSWEVAV